MTGLCRTNDGTQRFILVPIAEAGAPSGQYQYAPNQTYPRNQNKANATSYVIPFPLSQVSVLYITKPAQLNLGSSLAVSHGSSTLVDRDGRYQEPLMRGHLTQDYVCFLSVMVPQHMHHRANIGVDPPPPPPLLKAYRFGIETFTLAAPQILHIKDAVQHIALSRDPSKD